MLKGVRFGWIVAVGIFLIVTAATDTEDSVTNPNDETSEADFVEEAVTSTGKTDEHEGKESTVLSVSPNERSEANFTEKVESSTKVTEEDGEENDRKDSESLDDREDGIESSRVSRERKFKEDGETEERDVSCGAPPKIEGTIAPDLGDTEYKVGASISYQCEFGYVSRGGSGAFISTCKIDEETGTANWSQPDVSCVSRSCGDPGYVVNARRIGNLFTFPNKVEFHCEEGYKLRGLKARYCQANGDWSGRLPSCEQVYCQAPPDPLNGRVWFSSLEYGTELRYECNKGFVLSHREPRLCTNNGTWSNNDPECVEARCRLPESPTHGSVQLLGEPRVGSLVLYFCDEGTTLIGSSTAKCLSSGDWTFDPPKCMRFCQIPYISDGEVGRNERVRVSRYSSRTTWEFSKFQVGESVKHNETVTLRCHQGFSPVNTSTESGGGSVEVMCNNGLWNKPMLCQASACLGDPPPIENGSPVVEDNSHGKVIWYKCHHPDFDKKQGHIQCDRGTWKGHTPVCINTRCFMDQLNFPGLLKPEAKFLRSRHSFNITCSKGYKKEGSKEKIKCFNGTWDIVKNPCKIESCEDDPPSIMNGRPVHFAREHGSLVHYGCDEHFALVGASTVWCDVGKWEGQPPSCQEIVASAATSTGSPTGYEFGVSPGSLNILPASEIADGCSCTYDFEPNIVAVVNGGRGLHPGGEVKKDETVMLSCGLPRTILHWRNGLLIFGAAKLICRECKAWLQDELPTCVDLSTSSSEILYNDNMRILPGGAIEIIKNERFEITCINHWLQPSWHPPTFSSSMQFTNAPEYIRRETQYYAATMQIYSASDTHSGRYECLSNYDRSYTPTVLELRVVEREKQCHLLTENTRRGQFSITYGNDRKVNSVAYYTCKDNSQKLIGENSRRCLESGRWSGTFPSCEDITCWKPSTYNGLVVTYTNSNKVNSIAKFRCSGQRTLVGSNSTVCQHDGKWSNPWPKCQMLDIRCPLLDRKGIFSIHYSNHRRINSTAEFYCLAKYQRVLGCSVMTCQQNGEWSGTYPSCVDYVNCSRFQVSPPLEVSYSNDVRVDSIASFRCPPPNTLIGSSWAVCHFNETWSHPQPVCEAPKCSIDELFSSLPEGIVADLSEMADAYVELVPHGTEVQLLCEDGLIRIGNSKATCESQKWDYGNVQCVPGCRLNGDVQTHLLIDPVKEYYRFGDFILLSCPPGQKLSSDVERVICLGKAWSDDLPDCLEITQTSPSTLRETRKSA